MSNRDQFDSPENEKAPDALQCSGASAGESHVPEQDIDIIGSTKGDPFHGKVNGSLGDVEITYCRDIKNPADCLKIRLDQFVKWLLGQWRDPVGALRAQPDPALRKALKDLLPSVVPAGICKYRAAESIKELTRLAVLDFDHVNDLPGLRAKCEALPFAVVVHVSCSGKGIKLFVLLPDWVDSTRKFNQAIRVVMSRVEEMVGAKIDPSGKDICRASYVSFDPQVYFNGNATPFPLSENEYPVFDKPVRKSRPAGRAGASRNRMRVEKAVRYLASLGRPAYALWILIIAAVKIVMPKEEGIAFLREVLPEDEANEYSGKWERALDRITVEGFLAMAKSLGWYDDPTLGLSDRLWSFVSNAVCFKRLFHVPGPHGYLVLDARGLSRHMKELGAEAREHRDALTTWIENNRSVDGVLEIAGYASGIHEINGMRVLVPKSWTLAEARPGKHGLILRILSEMLGETQLVHLRGWLQHARRAYREGSTAPGQMLVVAGPVGCGKTLVCAIIAMCLGGRRADAVRYLTGDSAYNRELVAAGLLVADDGFLELTAVERSKLKARIKSYLYARFIELNAKFVDALSLPVTTRLVVAINDTAEALGSLPARSADLEDKTLLFKANHAPKGTLESMKGDDNALMAAITADLPGFLYHVDTYVIPEAIREPRSGVKSYWHPELANQLDDGSDELSPLAELLEVHRTKLAGVHTAREILTLIAPGENVDFASLAGPGGGRVSVVQLGRLLAKLAQKHPDLIEPAGERHRAKLWKIHPVPEKAA